MDLIISFNISNWKIKFLYPYNFLLLLGLLIDTKFICWFKF